MKIGRALELAKHMTDNPVDAIDAIQGSGINLDELLALLEAVYGQMVTRTPPDA